MSVEIKTDEDVVTSFYQVKSTIMSLCPYAKNRRGNYFGTP